MVDCSHANSSKKHENQIPVAADVASQIAQGDARLMGVMIESHLVAGRQDLIPGQSPLYGQSLTDACISWEDSLAVLDTLAQGVRQRRLILAAAH